MSISTLEVLATLYNVLRLSRLTERGDRQVPRLMAPGQPRKLEDIPHLRGLEKT